MSIKITVTKELNIDLNAYYPSFPKKLRSEIDQAIMGLVSSGAGAVRAANSGVREWGKVADGHHLTDDSRSVWCVEPGPARGRVKVAYNVVWRQHSQGKSTMKVFKQDLLDEGFPENQISSMLSYLWINRHIEVEVNQGASS